MAEEEGDSFALGLEEVVLVEPPFGEIVGEVIEEVAWWGTVVEGRVVPGWVGCGSGCGEGAGRVGAPSDGGGSGL